MSISDSSSIFFSSISSFLSVYMYNIHKGSFLPGNFCSHLPACTREEWVGEGGCVRGACSWDLRVLGPVFHPEPALVLIPSELRTIFMRRNHTFDLSCHRYVPAVMGREGRGGGRGMSQHARFSFSAGWIVQYMNGYISALSQDYCATVRRICMFYISVHLTVALLAQLYQFQRFILHFCLMSSRPFQKGCRYIVILCMYISVILHICTRISTLVLHSRSDSSRHVEL
jgi:hypothetical protein